MAAVAHELRNPIEGLSNALYLLQQSVLEDATRVYVDVAEKELERMKQIVGRLLDSYKSKSQPTGVTLSEVIDAVLAFYAHKIKFKNVAVQTRYSAVGLIQAIPGEMRQVFGNLIVNALEALPMQGGRLQVRLSQSRDWKHADVSGVRVMIADSGAGIRPPALNKIFSGTFTTKGTKGTGLGLWVSKRIIENHRGCIRVRSSVRPGRSWTCFTVFLPSVSGQDAQLAPAA